jgi:ketosteroid isomerase-like protein
VRQPVTLAELREIVAAFNEHSLDEIMSFFADDCEFLMPQGPEPEGRRWSSP